MSRLEIVALDGVPEVQAGDELAALVVAAYTASGLAPHDGDVVCVAQKVVSKAEGAVVPLPHDADAHAARRQLAREHATRVIADDGEILIVETHHGFVCANAGIDASNAPDGMLVLLPDDPDASARAIAAGIRERTGADVGVIVTDSFGRPWRVGQTDVAIGVAGIAPLRDERGGADRSGMRLEVTLIAVADELAAAADLVRRKASGYPFVVIRGADIDADADASARELVRPADEDLFRRGAR